MKLLTGALPTEIVAHWRAGGADACGCAPERVAASTGQGVPCRHCLTQVPAGRPYLIVAHRPFAGLNAYTETGPIFVCADDCPRGGREGLPAAMLTASHYLLRGYSCDERIVDGTGGVVATTGIADRCVELLGIPSVEFVHVRSASNNCYFFRVQRE